jgi:hypothetical protein
VWRSGFSPSNLCDICGGENICRVHFHLSSFVSLTSRLPLLRNLSLPLRCTEVYLTDIQIVKFELGVIFDLGGAQCEYQPDHLLSQLRFFMVFVSDPEKC